MVDHVNNLRKLGYTVIKPIEHARQKTLKRQFDRYLKSGLHIQNTRDHRMQMLKQPILYCPAIVPLYLNEQVLDILGEYFGSQPVVLSGNLRKSFVHKSKQVSTELFHRDRESKTLIKAFYYLNDIELGNGPHVYVEGSFNPDGSDDHVGYGKKKRFRNEDIIKLYGAKKIKYLVGKRGSIILANTTGFHRGAICRKGPRYMLTATFNPTPPTFESRYQMRRWDYKTLKKNDKKVFEYMELI